MLDTCARGVEVPLVGCVRCAQPAGPIVRGTSWDAGAVAAVQVDSAVFRDPGAS